MSRPYSFVGLIWFVVFMASCKSEPEKKIDLANQSSNLEMVQSIMQNHLDAVANRDLKTLESTLSPEGNMQLILPGTEIIEKTSGFMDYHREWFKATDWTMESKILNSEVGTNIAMVIVESIYKEPNRDGKPYFNRMNISYDLKKIKGTWYVIKDHMASIQKSTDHE